MKWPPILSSRISLICLIFFLLLAICPAPASAQAKKPAAASIAPDKQTVLGLYLKSKDAYALFRTNRHCKVTSLILPAIIPAKVP